MRKFAQELARRVDAFLFLFFFRLEVLCGSVWFCVFQNKPTVLQLIMNHAFNDFIFAMLSV